MKTKNDVSKSKQAYYKIMEIKSFNFTCLDQPSHTNWCSLEISFFVFILTNSVPIFKSLLVFLKLVPVTPRVVFAITNLKKLFTSLFNLAFACCVCASINHVPVSSYLFSIVIPRIITSGKLYLAFNFFHSTFDLIFNEIHNFSKQYFVDWGTTSNSIFNLKSITYIIMKIIFV